MKCAYTQTHIHTHIFTKKSTTSGPPSLSNTSTGPKRCDFVKKLRRGTIHCASPPFADTKITGLRFEDVCHDSFSLICIKKKWVAKQNILPRWGLLTQKPLDYALRMWAMTHFILFKKNGAELSSVSRCSLTRKLTSLDCTLSKCAIRKSHWCVWRDSIMCVTWLHHEHDEEDSCVRHDPFTCVTLTTHLKGGLGFRV